MINQIFFSLKGRARGCHLVTDEVMSHLPDLPEYGLVNLFVQHTSCALTINENFDPSVRADMNRALDKIAPEGYDIYEHSDEGLDDMPAHIKSSLIGVSLTIPINNGRLALGTWQGIYLCEFRNRGGNRKIVATIVS